MKLLRRLQNGKIALIKNKQKVEGYFFFDPCSPIYKDHFPGQPVVPGSLIVEAFCTTVQKLAGTKDTLEIEAFRFKKFIPPGRHAFIIEQQPLPNNDIQWQCCLLIDHRIAAIGVLIL